VTRGTRPKKPSSSRGFAREARRSWEARREGGRIFTGADAFFTVDTDGKNPSIGKIVSGR
jgi:hypothetical protein